MADKIYEVPGQGPVAFPDSMSDDEIVGVIRKGLGVSTPSTPKSYNTAQRGFRLNDKPAPGDYQKQSAGVPQNRSLDDALGDASASVRHIATAATPAVAGPLLGNPLPTIMRMLLGAGAQQGVQTAGQVMGHPGAGAALGDVAGALVGSKGAPSTANDNANAILSGQQSGPAEPPLLSQLKGRLGSATLSLLSKFVPHLRIANTVLNAVGEHSPSAPPPQENALLKWIKAQEPVAKSDSYAGPFPRPEPAPYQPPRDIYARPPYRNVDPMEELRRGIPTDDLVQRSKARYEMPDESLDDRADMGPDDVSKGHFGPSNQYRPPSASEPYPSPRDPYARPYVNPAPIRIQDVVDKLGIGRSGPMEYESQAPAAAKQSAPPAPAKAPVVTTPPPVKPGEAGPSLTRPAGISDSDWQGMLNRQANRTARATEAVGYFNAKGITADQIREMAAQSPATGQNRQHGGTLAEHAKSFGNKRPFSESIVTEILRQMGLGGQ